MSNHVKAAAAPCFLHCTSTAVLQVCLDCYVEIQVARCFPQPPGVVDQRGAASHINIQKRMLCLKFVRNTFSFPTDVWSADVTRPTGFLGMSPVNSIFIMTPGEFLLEIDQRMPHLLPRNNAQCMLGRVRIQCEHFVRRQDACLPQLIQQ